MLSSYPYVKLRRATKIQHERTLVLHRISKVIVAAMADQFIYLFNLFLYALERRIIVLLA